MTPKQLAEAKYNFAHNDPLDIVLLDEIDTITGGVTTVNKYDENSIIIQHVDENGLAYEIYDNEVFLKM